MNEGHVCGTRGSGIVFSAADVRWMIVVRGMREVGGVCDVYALGSGRRGWRGGDRMRGLGLGFTNPVVTGGMLYLCLCLGCGGVGGVSGQLVRGLDQGLEGWDGVMSV